MSTSRFQSAEQQIGEFGLGNARRKLGRSESNGARDNERRVRYIRSSGKTLQALAQELACHITTVWSAKHRTTPAPRVFKILHIFHGGLLRVEGGAWPSGRG